MAMQKSRFRFLFAGGGTGGHLFPAIAVAEKIKSILPEADILFVGTKSRIEGKVVPKLGFRFQSIWIKGFSRKFTFENILFPLKLIVSLIQSAIINLRFQPNVAIGTGGYVSGPAIWASSLFGAKVILVEQNSYPGVTTRMLQKYADEIHLSYEDSKKYFKDKKNLFVTGNPVREELFKINKEEAAESFGLNPKNTTLLVLGGSLGAGSINNAVAENLQSLMRLNIQLIWQTGTNYFSTYKHLTSNNVWISAFIENMSNAYSASDLVVARAGATTIAEILYLGLPSILVPSPNVAENHQYYNAASLSKAGAALLLEDEMLKENFIGNINSLILNESRLKEMGIIAKQISRPNATAEIANRAVAYAKEEVLQNG